MADCLFCSIIDGKIPAKIIHEDDFCVAYPDINPQAPTHILIVPRKHIPTTNDIAEEDAALIGQLFLAAKQIAAKEGIAEAGYRTVFNCNAAAGQAVFHIHLHLLGGRPLGWPPG
jgi:histidine triad (HIT) family protein